MILLPETIKEFEVHALSEFPREAVGYIINDKYVPLENSAKTPNEHFRISPSAKRKALANGPAQALLHSHPYDKNVVTKWRHETPSSTDMESWVKGDIPWGIASTCGEGISEIVWLDSSYIAPLIGRDFIHGIYDCYSLVKDWYKLNMNVDLPIVPRGANWWHTGKDLYDEHFEAAGFTVIPFEEATVGDSVMMKVASPVVNHAAVITGPNEITHHLINRLSGIDSLNKWSRCIVRAVRYTGKTNA